MIDEGTTEPQADTTHMVTYWVIPGGTDYENAFVVTVFFNKEQAAKAFTAAREMPPMLADCQIYDARAQEIQSGEVIK